MFRQRYCQFNERIVPTQKLVQETINKANGDKQKTNMTKHIYFKPVFTIISILICLSLITPVLAATVDPIYQLMYKVSPSVAQFFRPVQKSTEDNGIKMEVVSTYIHGNTAEIYITMQDLEGDRIDETIDLFDSYNINIPFDSIEHCQSVGYDEDTSTATFLITIEQCGNKKISEDIITFNVREFISKKTCKEKEKIDLNLMEYGDELDWQLEEPNGGSFRDEGMEFPTESKFLVPEGIIYKVMNNIEISNIGFVEGKFHVQMRVTEKNTLDPHGFIYLINDRGNVLEPEYSLSYKNITNGNEQTYDEFIFDVSREELKKYTLYGDFYSAGINTKGNWQVTFPLEQKQ